MIPVTLLFAQGFPVPLLVPEEFVSNYYSLRSVVSFNFAFPAKDSNDYALLSAVSCNSGLSAKVFQSPLLLYFRVLLFSLAINILCSTQIHNASRTMSEIVASGLVKALRRVLTDASSRPEFHSSYYS